MEVGCEPEEAYHDKRWKEQTADAEAATATEGCLRTQGPDIGEAFHLDIRYRRTKSRRRYIIGRYLYPCCCLLVKLGAWGIDVLISA